MRQLVHPNQSLLTVEPLAPDRSRRRRLPLALAAAAPLPWLLLAASNALTPDDLGGPYVTQYDAFAEHPTAAGFAVALSILCSVTLVPAAVALVVAARGIGTRAAALVAGLWFVGACCGAAAASMQVITYVATQEGLDRSATIALNQALEASPVYLVILPFALSITLGRILLAAVLWRARIAPRWMAVALASAVPVEWALGAVAGNAGPAMAYLLTAVGFASVSVALLRRSTADAAATTQGR